MFIFKNAWKNLIRNKSRNLLIGIILFIVIAASAVAAIINMTTEKIIDDYKNRFGMEATIIMDTDAVNAILEEAKANKKNGDFHFSFEAPQITTEEYIDYGQSDYVKSVSMVGSSFYSSDSLKAVSSAADTMNQEEANYSEMTREELVEKFGNDDTKINKILNSKPSIGKLRGYTSQNLMKEFNNGERKIKLGKMFHNDNECIVSKKFAELNNLQIGDTLNLGSTNKLNTNKLSLTITGVYLDVGEEKALTETQGRQNDILVNYNTLIKSGFTDIITTATYYLINADVGDKFLTELRSKGLEKTMTLSTEKATYNNIVEPVKNLKKVSITFLIGILITGALVLIFLSVISIRERKYEIGVLRAIGMKKLQISKGLLCESLSIVAICLILGISVGNIVSEPISNVLLNSQTQTLQDDDLTKGEDNREVTTLDHIDFSLNLYVVLEITFGAVALGLLSSLVGILYITKYEPIKILSERN